MVASLHQDLRTLASFIGVYCKHRHRRVEKSAARLKAYDVPQIAGRGLELCPSCLKLLAHALSKRSHCPLEPKPTCKNCPQHCYHPTYRKQIREVMKYSGRRMVLSGRLDYLFHLLF